jgi:hypothetical protein
VLLAASLFGTVQATECCHSVSERGTVKHA